MEKNRRWPGRLLAVLAAIAAVVSVAWVISASRLDDAGAAVFVALVSLWLAAPYAMLGLTAIYVATAWPAWAVAALGLAAGVWVSVLMFDAVAADARGPLVLLVGPLYQFLGAAIVAGLTYAVDALHRRLRGG